MYITARALAFHRTPPRRTRTAHSFKKAATTEELREIFKLRYKVYCEEKGFERSEDHPGGIEYDEFDKSSRHFMVTSGPRLVIGTARLILDSGKGLPVRENCKIEADLSRLETGRLAEISRLAISKEYMKDLGISSHRSRQEVICGLYKLIYIESRMLGLTHWLAVMTEGLSELLKRSGIVFAPIGPPADYHGIRTPYIGSIADIEAQVSKINPGFFRETREEFKLLMQ
ncbi:MAG TPA: PEP-CTERM/exosortase system-associated acyltransferase [Thermodesulfobacteriota bacterium]